VRIIAGRFRGRRLKTPAWEGLRPTSDKLRETLFNVVSARVAGARVVDGYAGTGAIGLEALSRGAGEVVFVERDARAAALIAANLKLCGVEEGYTIEHGDVGTVLRRFGPDEGFDLIFLDPPYGDDSIVDARAAAGSRLRAYGLLVLERPTRREPVVPSRLERTREVRSRDSTRTLFVRSAAGDPPSDH
jgi:16S rRNA (guanine966-N2)-methyltransferase